MAKSEKKISIASLDKVLKEQAVDIATEQWFGNEVKIKHTLSFSEALAYQAGLQTGDVIVEVNGEECLTMQKLNEKLYRCQSGQSVNVLVKRLGKSGYFEVSYDVNVEYR